MPLTAFQCPVQTDPAVDFIEGLADNAASATVNLKLPWRESFAFIRAISIVSVEARTWELQFFSRAENLGDTLQTDYFNSFYQFTIPVVGPPASAGWPIAADDQSPTNAYYRYHASNLMLPYYDEDLLHQDTASAGANGASAQLHVRLVNRSASAKTAGAGGAVLVTFFVASAGQQV